jgi:hypothetical protein
MSASKNPSGGKGGLRPTLGLIPAILDRSPLVVEAFGRGPGFVLIVTAMIASTGGVGFIVMTLMKPFIH